MLTHLSTAPVPHRLVRRIDSVLALCALVVALPAAAAVSDISFVPEAPTWQDEVLLVVRGQGIGCPSLSEPTYSYNGGEVIQVVLQSTCEAPTPTSAFEVQRSLGHLTPQEYSLVVRSPAGELFGSVSVQVYGLADLGLTLPTDAVTSDEEATVTVSGVAQCPQLNDVTIGEGSVEIEFGDECPILPFTGVAYFAEPVTFGPLAPGTYEVRVLQSALPWPKLVKRELQVYDPQHCVPSEGVLCLGEERFAVAVSWNDFTGGSGVGHAIPLADREDTGLLWFFNPDNVELTIKVLDGCGVNGRYWVFVSSGSTVEYTITVTDTEAHLTKTFTNDLGEVPALEPDTDAFASCP